MPTAYIKVWFPPFVEPLNPLNQAFQRNGHISRAAYLTHICQVPPMTLHHTRGYMQDSLVRGYAGCAPRTQLHTFVRPCLHRLQSVCKPSRRWLGRVRFTTAAAPNLQSAASQLRVTPVWMLPARQLFTGSWSNELVNLRDPARHWVLAGRRRRAGSSA